MQLKHLEDIKLVAVDDVCYHVRGRRIKKSKKELTSVSFAFTHTYTLEKLTLLLFFPKRTWKILKNVQNAKEKNISFHYIVPRTVKSSIHF